MCPSLLYQTFNVFHFSFRFLIILSNDSISIYAQILHDLFFLDQVSGSRNVGLQDRYVFNFYFFLFQIYWPKQAQETLNCREHLGDHASPSVLPWQDTFMTGLHWDLGTFGSQNWRQSYSQGFGLNINPWQYGHRVLAKVETHDDRELAVYTLWDPGPPWALYKSQWPWHRYPCPWHLWLNLSQAVLLYFLAKSILLGNLNFNPLKDP